MDACASVAKSDTIIDEALQDELRAAFTRLREDTKDSPDWHPRTDEKVLDLVHPSLYPLVYKHTRLFRDEVVGVENAIDEWAGKGDILDGPKDTLIYSDYDTMLGGSAVPPTFWSETYQWLPANMKFQDDGSLKFTSYINNLHPVKYSGIYRTIEKLVEKALPAWDLCLTQMDSFDKSVVGRTKPRFPKPDSPE